MGAGLACAAGQPGEQLGLHGDDGVGLESEGVVGVAATRGARPLAGKVPSGEALGVTAGVQGLCECLCAAALPDCPQRPEVDLSLAGLESLSGDLLSSGR